MGCQRRPVIQAAVVRFRVSQEFRSTGGMGAGLGASADYGGMGGGSTTKAQWCEGGGISKMGVGRVPTLRLGDFCGGRLSSG